MFVVFAVKKCEITPGLKAFGCGSVPAVYPCFIADVQDAPGPMKGNSMPEKIRTFEEWWESLEEGRKKVLLEDRWMMARAAYAAGGVAVISPNHLDFNQG